MLKPELLVFSQLFFLMVCVLHLYAYNSSSMQQTAGIVFLTKFTMRSL